MVMVTDVVPAASVVRSWRLGEASANVANLVRQYRSSSKADRIRSMLFGDSAVRLSERGTAGHATGLGNCPRWSALEVANGSNLRLRTLAKLVAGQ